VDTHDNVDVPDEVVDVPSDHDYFDRDYVRRWAAKALVTLPQREAFFDAVAAEALALRRTDLRILELGSGPGFLAERLLEQCPISSYWLFDFSPLMHDLARERLARFGSRAVFVEGDFRQPDWQAALPGRFHMVVSAQAVHELRHVTRVPDLYRRATTLLAPGGLLAVCDIVKRDDDDRPLLLTAAEQLKAMGAAGLRGPRVALVDERLGLFVGRGPDGPDQRPVPAGLA